MISRGLVVVPTVCGLAALGLGGCFGDRPEARAPGVVATVEDLPDALRGEDVVEATPAPPAIAGGSLLVAAEGALVVVGDPDRDRIAIVELETERTVGAIEVGSGAEPGRAVEDAEGLVHVVLRATGEVLTLDPTTATELRRQTVCPSPRGIAYDGARVLVACLGGEVVALDPATTSIQAKTRLALDDLRDIGVVERDGVPTVWVTRFRHADLVYLDAELEPTQIVDFTMGSEIPSMAPSVAWRARTFEEEEVVILHQASFVAAVPTNVPVAYYSAGLQTGPCFAGRIVQSVITRISGDRVMSQTFAPELPLAVDFAMAADGAPVAVSAARRGSTTFALGASAARVETGSFPPCGVLSKDGVEPVPQDGDIQLVAVDALPQGGFAFFSREPAVLYTPDHTIKLSSESREDTGHDIFHLDTGGGVACASCHPEGGEDAHVWTFAGIGPRRTQSLRGVLSGSEPFHWSGDLVDMVHLGAEVYSNRMGGGQLSDEQSVALVRYLDAIPLLPPREGLDPVAVDHGRDIFQGKAGCTECHLPGVPPPSANFDVGTGVGEITRDGSSLPFQTPILDGVSFRDPFIHNGCASTLIDRFGDETCGGGDKHGNVSILTEEEKQALVTYMSSL